MKTIKFRAWDKKNKKMTFINDITFNVDDGSINQVSTGFMEHGENEDAPGDLEDVVLLEHTGLKDKHGKNIFEGDIVEAWSQGAKGTFEVLWRQEGLPCFILYPAYQKGEMWKLHGSKHENGIYYDKGVEVIGNKFEHPELLEQPNAN